MRFRHRSVQQDTTATSLSHVRHYCIFYVFLVISSRHKISPNVM